MSRLSKFVRENTEEILTEWEAFARALPIEEAMDVTALRDHAKGMLLVIASDLETTQTSQEETTKANGHADSPANLPLTPAQKHGAGRAESGFNVSQMVAEFRALRASVIRLWTSKMKKADLDDLEDITRFNEAIDQAIAESITRFTGDISESKERFISILSHDLRTPLGYVITATTFMLESSELKEPNLTLVKRIGTSSRRMNQMVLDLLDFTHARLGDSIPVARADMDARRMVSDVVVEIATLYPNTDVHVETSGELRGEWDCARLTQMMTNLIGNAAQHGSGKSPVNVVARGTDKELTISVHNDGPAIPDADLPELFGAMKRGKPDPKRDRRHLGLGLYIVDKIVKGHGGSIDVQSSEQKGTTFTVQLPRANDKN